MNQRMPFINYLQRLSQKQSIAKTKLLFRRGKIGLFRQKVSHERFETLRGVDAEAAVAFALSSQ
jgi:hypothetical protein